MQISKLINAARISMRPLAYLQSSNGMSFDDLGVRIGRYEPVFTIPSIGEALPSRLIDFIVGNAANQVQLAGVAARSQFEHFGLILLRSGFTTTIESQSALMLDGLQDDDANRVQMLSQFMENDPFTANPFAWSASMKNQSTRWPNA